jgi:hypothetical protein
MRILHDNCTPRGIARALRGHAIKECRSQGWDRLKNGELLDAAEAAGFEVFLTADQSIRYQPNLGVEKWLSLCWEAASGSSFSLIWIESGKRSKALSPEA